MPDSPDQRRCSRVSAHLKATVSFEGGWEVETTMVDLSMSGLFVEVLQAVPIGTACDVGLHVDRRRPGVTINLHGRVARITPAGLGIEIGEFDRDAFDFLRKIVLDTSGDPRKIEAELAAFLGRRRPS
jgi:hypothetical protein